MSNMIINESKLVHIIFSHKAFEIFSPEGANILTKYCIVHSYDQGDATVPKLQDINPFPDFSNPDDVERVLAKLRGRGISSSDGMYTPILAVEERTPTSVIDFSRELKRKYPHLEVIDYDDGRTYFIEEKGMFRN